MTRTVVQIRLEPAEKRRLVADAKIAGESVSSYVRSRLDLGHREPERVAASDVGKIGVAVTVDRGAEKRAFVANYLRMNRGRYRTEAEGRRQAEELWKQHGAG